MFFVFCEYRKGGMSGRDIVYVDGEEDLLKFSKNGDLTVLSLNIRSLTNKLSLFELFLNSLSENNNSVDVIFLTETFLKSDSTDFYNIEGYKAFHFTRESRNGGGIVFYVKNDIKVDSSIQKFSCREVQFLIMNLVGIKTKLCGVYRPPTSIHSNQREFMDMIDEILETNKNMTVLGDININLLDSTSEELVEVVCSNNFEILNKLDKNSYTRRDRISSSIIDHAYTDLNKDFVLQVSDNGLSDHRHIMLIVKDSGLNVKRQIFSKKFVNYESFR